MDKVPWAGIAWVGPWLVAGAICAAAAGGRLGGFRPQRRDVVIVTALFVLGLALRLGLGIWGPFHVNGQGPHWVASAFWNPALLASYGPGYSETLGWVARLFPRSPDSVIFGTNVVLAALVAPLTYALARGLSLEELPAVTIGAVVAVDPVWVRMAASEGYFSVLVVLTLGTAILSAQAQRQLVQRRKLAGLALAVAAGLLAAQVARTHPVGWLPLALALLVPWAKAASLPGGEPRWCGAMAVTGVLAVVPVVLSGGWILLSLEGVLASSVPGSYYSLAKAAGVPWLVVVPLAVVLSAAAWWVRPKWVYALGAVALLGMVATRDNYWQSPLWRAAYDRLFLSLVLLAPAALIPPREWPVWRRIGGWSYGLALAGAMVWAGLVFAAYAPGVARLNTEQLEYRFLRAQIELIPGECQLAVPLGANQSPLRIPDYASSDGRHLPERTPTVVSSSDLAALAKGGECTYYVRISSCSRDVHAAICRGIEMSAHLQPVAELELPARPSFLAQPYGGESVRIGVYRVDPEVVFP